MAKRTKKSKWFIRVRGSYLPNSWQGWLTYIPFVAYLVIVAIVSWHRLDHVLAVLFIFVSWVVAVAIETWVAKRTS